MSLNRVTFFGESLVSDNLENNIIYWLNWNLLSVGAFYNNRISTSGSYGGETSRLRLSNDPNFTTGRVWESFRKQWIWQSGVDWLTQPIQISGVYVNNVFRPASGVGPHSFKVDYPNGRIIFNSAISTTSTVKAEYSCPHYQIYNADTPIWREIQKNSFRIDDSSFLISSSGIFSKSTEARLQLPAIIVEATPNVVKKPYEHGSLAGFHEQEFRFYIICETNRDRKWIIDVLTNQHEQQHNSFDTNLLWRSGLYPLNQDGSLNPLTINYPDIVTRFNNNCPWRFLKFRGSIPNISTESPGGIFPAVLNVTVETFV